MGTYIGLSFVIIGIIIMLVIVMGFMKPGYRKYKYLVIKKALDDDNRKKVTNKEDLEELEFYLSKFGWYAKNWYVNLTPTYQSRWKKFKKIVEKYDLDIEIFDYKEEEK